MIFIFIDDLSFFNGKNNDADIVKIIAIITCFSSCDNVTPVHGNLLFAGVDCNGKGTCVKTLSGLVICRCHPGYKAVGQQCKKHGCLDHPCPVTARCLNDANAPNGYICLCGEKVCPMKTHASPIHRRSILITLMVKLEMTRGKCPLGYEVVRRYIGHGLLRNAKKLACQDMNECKLAPGICGQARCINKKGHLKCQCIANTGKFRRKDATCATRPNCREGDIMVHGKCQVDKCQPNPCGPSQVCKQVGASYKCYQKRKQNICLFGACIG